MKVYQHMTFADLAGRLFEDFSRDALPVDVGQWQGLDIKGDSSKVTWELREVILAMKMPDSMNGAQREYLPNLPWAEDHFQERVSSEPLNPPPSSEWWPFAQQGNEAFVKDRKFSHTYPERFWPKHAGHPRSSCPYIAETDEGTTKGFYSSFWDCDHGPRHGIRFHYGDLNDVVSRLIANPLTRQAYLPVWFPEDTGAPENERVPCSLGYHFMIRQDKLHLTYHIRACDMMRHFRDDVYMAVRLGQWVKNELFELSGNDQLRDLTMGELTMHIGSFHIFEGDRAMVKYLANRARSEREDRLRKALG